MKRVRHLGIVALLLAGSAGAQELPEGWHLMEEESGGVTNLNLAWHAPGSGEVLIAFNCSAGYPEVILSVFVPAEEPAEAPVAVELSDGERRFAFESLPSPFDGRQVIETQTVFGPELAALLEKGFALSVGGTARGEFSGKSGKGEIARIVEGCR